MLENNSMDNMSWRMHVKGILKGTRKSLLSRVMNTSNKSAQRARLMNMSLKGFQDEKNTILTTLTLELESLFNNNNSNNKKVNSMDSFTHLKNVDRMIAHLKEATKDDKDYQRVIEESEYKIDRFKRKPASDREVELFTLGLILIEAAKYNDTPVLKEYLDLDFPINFQDPRSNTTALHRSLPSAYEFAQMLLGSGKCNLLLKDNTNRLAYDVAYEHCYDIELAEKLEEETIKQALAKDPNTDTKRLFQWQHNPYFQQWLDHPDIEP